MALIPKGSIELGFPDQLKIWFEDITGVYNATTNPGGYGAPNIEIGDVNKTVLKMKAPGSDVWITLTDWDYLPTDAEAAEITCDMYDASLEEEEEEEECIECPDDVLLTDCEPEVATCFVDGCWEFEYEVYVDGLPAAEFVLEAEVTWSQFFYTQTLKRLMDLDKVIKSGMVRDYENWNWEGKLNDAWNDYQRMLLSSSLNDCDCNCISTALASVQKKLTEMEGRI